LIGQFFEWSIQCSFIHSGIVGIIGEALLYEKIRLQRMNALFLMEWRIFTKALLYEITLWLDYTNTLILNRSNIDAIKP